MNKTAASLIKKLAAILTLLLLGLSVYSQELHPKAPRVPEKIIFAGETIRFDSDDMYERMDRELLSFTYMHTNTTLMLKRSKRIFSIVVPILKRNGIPEDLKYLMAIESNLDPKAVSTAGAAGLWQFMKGTGREYGLEVGAEVDERFHIEKATIAACKYLKSAYSAFGDWMTVAASYNSGRGGILKRREEQGERSAFNLMLPEETTRYMFRVLAAKMFFENPSSFGFNFSPDEYYPVRTPARYETVSGPIPSLVDFAKLNGVTYRELKLANPWLTSTSLENKNGKTYKIAIPGRSGRR